MNGELDFSASLKERVGLLKGVPADVFEKFDKILVCELNSGQFVNYLRALMPQFKYEQFNKVQGQPFLVQEITTAIKENF